MAQLRHDYQQFKDSEAEIIVVGPEDADDFRREWEKEQYPFVGLPDPEHQVADLYGQETRLTRLGRLPALVVIDRSGHIIYQHYGDSMRDIVPNEELLALLGPNTA